MSVAEETVAPVEEHHTSTGLDNTKMAMWAFLGSECLFFGSMITTYLLYRRRLSGSAEGPLPFEIYDIPFTSVSSFVLLMSSLTMVLALSSIQRADQRGMRTWLLATALLGTIFIGGQIYEFTTFVDEGMKFGSSPASSAFYMLTGFHGAHVTGGIFMLLALVGLSLSGKLRAPADARKVELIGLYWHFVDIVWIVIFTVVYLIPH
jgi:cytochrome c oxidase subunit 3/cytochrome o ubiquinol oxidase subunit 3